MKALRQRDCDLFAIETIPSLKEADAVLQTLKEHPSTKAWVTFSCQDGHSYKVSSKDDVLKTAYGDSWADSVITLSEKYGRDGLMGVGINCTRPSSIIPLLDSLKSHAKFSRLDPDMKIILYPNSGENWSPEKGYYRSGDSFRPFKDFGLEWLRYELGERDAWVGGCCQVFPSDVASLHLLCYRDVGAG